jgi:hypothetical protein
VRIESLGDAIGAKNKWELRGMDAIALYLAKKYGWTIEHCRALSIENLLVALHEELKNHRNPNLIPVLDVVSDCFDNLKKIAKR